MVMWKCGLAMKQVFIYWFSSVESLLMLSTKRTREFHVFTYFIVSRCCIQPQHIFKGFSPHGQIAKGHHFQKRSHKTSFGYHTVIPSGDRFLIYDDWNCLNSSLCWSPYSDTATFCRSKVQDRPSTAEAFPPHYGGGGHWACRGISPP